MLEIDDLFGDITNAANAQVALLANFMERNLDWKKLKYMQYNDFLKALDTSGRVREMINQQNSAQQRKTRATKKLGDLWQHHPEVQGILSDSCGSEEWIRLTAIDNHTCSDPGSAKRCLNCSVANPLTKLNRKSKTNMLYTTGDFQQGKMLVDNGCHQLEEGIDYKATGLLSYQGLVMPLIYFPGMDDHKNTNRLHTILPSLPPADHIIPPAEQATVPVEHGTLPTDNGIPPADHRIHVLLSSHNQSKMLPPPTPPTKGKEKE